MAQSLSNLLVHLIFSTKGRVCWICEGIIGNLHQYMAGIAKQQGALLHEIGGVNDHVHILVGLPRTLSVSKLVEEIKKGSSKWMKTQGECYKEFSWQSGYGAFSIGQSSFDAVVHYIQNQRDHHNKVSFQDEYRIFLQRYKVTFDEQYLWD